MNRLTESNFLKENIDMYAVLRKLCEYEDLEEQELLVKIECRCKDCVHSDCAGCNGTTLYCMKNECYMQHEDFCIYAERTKEENNE